MFKGQVYQEKPVDEMKDMVVKEVGDSGICNNV